MGAATVAHKTAWGVSGSDGTMVRAVSHEAGSTTADAPRRASGSAGRFLSPAAERALMEAAARRAEIDRRQAEAAKEVKGRGGLDPVRYGDWEIKGLASDF